MEKMGTFHGTEVDFAEEYCNARKLMGQRDTDLDKLFESVGLLFLNCPEDLNVHYQSLLEEITARQGMTTLGLK